MNGTSQGHRAILMRSMLQFAMHYGRYRRRYHYNITQCRRRGILMSTPVPAINLVALLDDQEENLRSQQINVTHASIMDLLGNPGNPLYAEPHSMAEHFDALIVGARAIGELPGRMHCKGCDAMARVHDEEATQVRQKILRCLDMRVLGQGLGSADLSEDAYLDPPHWSLHAAVLQPRQARAVHFSVPGGWSRIPTAAWGHQDLYCAKGFPPTPGRRATTYRPILSSRGAGS